MFGTCFWRPVYAQVDLKDCVITIKDGSGTPQSCTVKIGEGNLTWTERKNIEYTLDGGTIDEVREGDEVPVDVTISAVWEYVTSSTGGSSGQTTLIDAIKGTGSASDWVSSDSDICRPYAVDIQIVYTPDCAGSIVETILLADFRYEQIDFDLRGGTFQVTGKCNITEPAITLS